MFGVGEKLIYFWYFIKKRSLGYSLFYRIMLFYLYVYVLNDYDIKLCWGGGVNLIKMYI